MVPALNPQFSCDPQKRKGDVDTDHEVPKLFQRESLASRAAANCENAPNGRKISSDKCNFPRSQPIINTLTVLDIGENRRLNAAVLGAFFAFDDDVPESNMASRFARRLPHRAFPEYAVQGTATLFQQEDARCLPGFYTHHRSYAPFSIH